MRSLATLLHPYSVEEFLQHNWTNKAVIIPSQGQKKFAHLFSWEKLNHLLNYHQLKYPDLRLALDGKVLDESQNANIINLCQQGATIILDQLHKLIPEITTFAAEIKYDLGYGTQVNAYCSWPGKQGFSCHYDTHEVFILQVEGNKQWHVFTETLKCPLPDQKSTSLPAPKGEPYLRCILSPGDVLYIPRGHWHYAVASDEPSLHLTLGIHGKTGMDFLEWLVSELREKEQWRQTLPLPVEGEWVDAHINSLIQDLTQDFKNNNYSEKYSQYLQGLSKPIERYSFPQQAGFNIFPMGVQTRFKRPKFQRVKISDLTDGSRYKIIASGKEVSLRGVTSTLVENLFSRDIFTGEDVMNWLPDFDWEVDIVPFLSMLVLQGIILVDC